MANNRGRDTSPSSQRQKEARRVISATYEQEDLQEEIDELMRLGKRYGPACEHLVRHTRKYAGEVDKKRTRMRLR